MLRWLISRLFSVSARPDAVFPQVYSLLPHLFHTFSTASAFIMPNVPRTDEALALEWCDPGEDGRFVGSGGLVACRPRESARAPLRVQAVRLCPLLSRESEEVAYALSASSLECSANGRSGEQPIFANWELKSEMSEGGYPRCAP